METPCDTATKNFVDKLIEIYVRNEPKNRTAANDKDKDKMRESILNWINTGKDSPYIDTLLSPPFSKDIFPIWWSGFWLENPDSKTNPVKDMASASLVVNGYSSIDTLMTTGALSEQNNFWSECSKGVNFKWGEYSSKTYTQLALKSNPKQIGLFVSKDKAAFVESDFYKVEFDLILKHYNRHKQPVTLYIFNKEKYNCTDIQQLLESKRGEVNKYINFVCVECDQLVDCARSIKRLIGSKSHPSTTGVVSAKSLQSNLGGKKEKTYKKSNRRKTHKAKKL
jgi:hypothetical protein